MLAGNPVALSGGWTATDTFTFDVVMHHTPFSTRYLLRFAGDELQIEVQPNVGPTSKPQTL